MCKVIKEYLDKEYMKPLYDKLRNSSERFSDSFSVDENMMVGFFTYLLEYSDDDTFNRVANALRKYEIKKYHINLVKDCNSIGGRRNIAILNNDYKRVDKVFDFIDKNKKKIYKICFNDSILLDALDKFYFYVNSHKNMISNNRQVTKSVNVEKMLRFPELLKPQWLLHFTPSKDNAIDICLNGFRRGMNLANIDKLAYSNSDDYEKNGKFCYAYDAKGFVESSLYTPFTTKEDWRFDNSSDQKVWERAIHNCVMFIGNGVKAYHLTDKEYQVIFNADSARNFVLLSYMEIKHNELDPRERGPFNNGWHVRTLDGKTIYSNPSIKNVVAWVMNNYGQYHKKVGKYENKLKSINGYPLDEVLHYAKKWNHKSLIPLIKKAYLSGEIDDDVKALINSLSIQDEREYNMRRNGLMRNESKKIYINEKQEDMLISEGIKIHKGEKGKHMSTQGKWEDTIQCSECGGDAHFTMSISDGNKGRGRIKVTDENGVEKDSEVQTIALYYCPKCFKFIARNNMA